MILQECIAAAAKSLQSCPTLCDPIDSSPPGSPVPGILQARTLEWVAMSFSNVWKWKVKVKLLSRVPLFMTPWTAAYQAPPSMGFSRQEYWSGVPSPSPSYSIVQDKAWLLKLDFPGLEYQLCHFLYLRSIFALVKCSTLLFSILSWRLNEDIYAKLLAKNSTHVSYLSLCPFTLEQMCVEYFSLLPVVQYNLALCPLSE